MRARIPLIASVVLCTICGLSVPLLAQRPPGVDERFRQASEFMRNGNLNAAAEAFAAVVKEAPDFAPAHLNLGLVREEQGHHEEAIASFQKTSALACTRPRSPPMDAGWPLAAKNGSAFGMCCEADRAPSPIPPLSHVFSLHPTGQKF